MSILIKDLEMPTCCWDCPIQVNPFCAANDIIDLEERTKRPDKCPLTKVPENVQPIVRCKDCIYWKDWHVRYPDGRERQYLPEEYEDIDGYKLLVPSVTSDVGINVAPQCMYEKNRGWSCDKTVFKNADDYCSRAEKRTSSYESCWGICDGWYALESGD